MNCSAPLAGIIFVNLKIIRSFNKLSLYIYIHDSFLDLLFFNLKKNFRFLIIKKIWGRLLYRKYRWGIRLLKKNRYKILRLLKKKIILKYGRKFLFLFIKNKILRTYWDNFKALSFYYLKKFSITSHSAKIFVVGLSKMNVNSNIISEFFFIRLSQYYTI